MAAGESEELDGQIGENASSSIIEAKSQYPSSSSSFIIIDGIKYAKLIANKKLNELLTNQMK